MKGRRIISFVLLGFWLLTFPFLFKLPFPRHLMIMIFLYAMLGEAWNLLGGYTGQAALGHAVYFGIGAYTSTILFQWFNLTPWLGMLGGALLAIIISFAIGYPCFRLRGFYFAIATIALGEIVQTIFLNWKMVGGAVGLFVPLVEESFLSFQFHSTKLPYYYISLAMLLIALYVCYQVERSRLGFYFRAIREDQEAATSLGINPAKYKLIALIISVFFTSIGGSFYAQYVLYIDPYSVLPLMLSVRMCLVAVLGGLGTLLGPILGAVVLVPLSEFTRVYLGGGGTAIDLVVYGFLIILVAVFQPLGLMGYLRRFKL